MNKLTRDIVTETAKRHKSLAVKNGDKFAWKVECAHWNYILDKMGCDRMIRAGRLMSAFHPELQIDDYENLPVRIAQPQMSLF